MIQERRIFIVLMVISFIVCFFCIGSVFIEATKGDYGLSILLVLVAWSALALHGYSSMKMYEKSWIGRPISYNDLADESNFQIIEEIGLGYFRVAPDGYDPQAVISRIVYDLPIEIAMKGKGCVFTKRQEELFIKTQPAETERHTSWDMCI
jgi:hypothetical protein